MGKACNQRHQEYYEPIVLLYNYLYPRNRLWNELWTHKQRRNSHFKVIYVRVAGLQHLQSIVSS